MRRVPSEINRHAGTVAAERDDRYTSELVGPILLNLTLQKLVRVG